MGLKYTFFFWSFFYIFLFLQTKLYLKKYIKNMIYGYIFVTLWVLNTLSFFGLFSIVFYFYKLNYIFIKNI